MHPALSLNFAVQHDAGIRQCLEDLLHTPVTSEMWEMASLPFSTGGLGLRNAQRTRSTAYGASWADVVPMIRLRHPEVADHIVLSLSRGLGGFPTSRVHPDDEFPSFSRQGWQIFASSQMEEAFFQHNVVPRLEPTEQALVRSQRGLMAGIPFFCPPVSCASRFDAQCFRVLCCAGFGVL